MSNYTKNRTKNRNRSKNGNEKFRKRKTFRVIRGGNSRPSIKRTSTSTKRASTSTKRTRSQLDAPRFEDFQELAVKALFNHYTYYNPSYLLKKNQNDPPIKIQDSIMLFDNLENEEDWDNKMRKTFLKNIRFVGVLDTHVVRARNSRSFKANNTIKNAEEVKRLLNNNSGWSTHDLEEII